MTSAPTVTVPAHGASLMPADPMEDRRCTARSKQSGERCKRFVTPGARVCFMHGGGSPAVRAKAAQRLAEQRARRTLAALELTESVIDPFAALEALAGQAVGLVEILRGMVSDLEEIRYRGGPGSGTEQLRAELAAYLSALGRAESILARIVSLDLEGRRVRLAEAQTTAIVLAIDKVLASADLALDAARQRRGRELLARALGSLAVSKPLAGPQKIPGDLVGDESHLMPSQALETKAVN